MAMATAITSYGSGDLHRAAVEKYHEASNKTFRLVQSDEQTRISGYWERDGCNFHQHKTDFQWQFCRN